MPFFVFDRQGNAVLSTEEEARQLYQPDGRPPVLLDERCGSTLVETVFLVEAESTDSPVLWETIVSIEEEQRQLSWRYTSWQSAQIGHEEIVGWVRDGMLMDRYPSVGISA